MRDIHPNVTIPYWNWQVDKQIPAPLAHLPILATWNVQRGVFDPTQIPDSAAIDVALATGGNPPSFTAFQSAMEELHDGVHDAVGGTMGTSRSPADPLFWLHHAFIDKLWAHWENAHVGDGFAPPNLNEQMQPEPIISTKVSDVVSIALMGFSYA